MPRLLGASQYWLKRMNYAQHLIGLIEILASNLYKTRNISQINEFENDLKIIVTKYNGFKY